MKKKNKQQLLLEYAISSPDVFGMCAHIIKPEYFNPEYRNTVEFIQKYYTEYNVLPDPTQIYAESNIELDSVEVGRDKINYFADEIEKFCKHEAVKNSIVSSLPLIEKGDYGAIIKSLTDAITISLHRDIGVDFFQDVLARIEAREQQTQYYTTGYPGLDELIGGGLERRTITMLQANSGGGKSIAMANLSINLLDQGLNVLYLSLELYADQVDRRFQAMVAEVHPKQLMDRKVEVARAIESKHGRVGGLYIKYMPSGSTPSAIRAYLKEFELHHKFLPDAIVLDYLDLMRPDEKVSADNVFERDKLSSEQFRNILVEYNMIGITASQQNRGAINASKIDQSHIAGGMSKQNTVDTSMSIIFNEIMMAKGEIGLQMVKTRNNDGQGKTVFLVWDKSCLRIRNPAGKGLKLSNQIQTDFDEDDNTSLIDLID